MAEDVRFHFDPACPFTYQASRWIRRASELGAAAVSWDLFCLEVHNRDGAEISDGTQGSGPALRTALLLLDEQGSDALGRFYQELGRRRHEKGQPLAARRTIEGALDDAGLEIGTFDRATNDPQTWQRVVDRHRWLAETEPLTGSPTLVFGGAPGITGPVLMEVPNDEDTVAMVEHVAWLARRDYFSELKRQPRTLPDLESVRQFQRGESED